MSKDNGGSAFPIHCQDGEPITTGMTLRDYFAIHAPDLVGDHMKPEIAGEYYDIPLPDKTGNTNKVWKDFWNKVDARARYEFADAMLAQRQKSA